MDKPLTFQERLAQMIATRPNVTHKQPIRKAVPHKLVFSAVGKAGERKVIAVAPECMFRGESIDAKDTLDGAGTKIEMLLVGKKLQRLNPSTDAPMKTPIETRELMRAIRQGAFAFKMDTCQEMLTICIAVVFEKDCEFRAEISGRAVK